MPPFLDLWLFRHATRVAAAVSENAHPVAVAIPGNLRTAQCFCDDGYRRVAGVCVRHCESSRSAFCERPGKGSGAAVQTKGLQENFPGAQPERIMQPRVTELAG